MTISLLPLIPDPVSSKIVFFSCLVTASENLLCSPSYAFAYLGQRYFPSYVHLYWNQGKLKAGEKIPPALEHARCERVMKSRTRRKKNDRWLSAILLCKHVPFRTEAIKQLARRIAISKTRQKYRHENRYKTQTKLMIRPDNCVNDRGSRPSSFCYRSTRYDVLLFCCSSAKRKNHGPNSVVYIRQKLQGS